MDLFSGKDRIEQCEALGRPIRKGNLSELSISDHQRVIEALKKEDKTAASTYLSSLHPLYCAMVSTFLEWCIALPASLHNIQSEYSSVLEECNKTWYEIVTADEDLKSDAIESFQEIFSKLTDKSIISYRSNPENESLLVLKKPQETFIALNQLIEEEKFSDAQDLFCTYFDQMRLRHDLAAEYVSTFGGIIADQDISSQVTQQALEGSALISGMWQLVELLDAHTLASVLAEHLRGHFSGEGRKGAVEVIEEDDRYRLVFAPCGTGGALRSRCSKGLKKFSKATKDTWNKTDVPSYCVHCAKNEITSLEKFGYPAWVTEFDPDPQKPCGWTVYKKPELIPEEYFTRIGAKKDPSAFKK